MQVQKKNYHRAGLRIFSAILGMALCMTGCTSVGVLSSQKAKNPSMSVSTEAKEEETSQFQDYRSIVGVVVALDTKQRVLTILNTANRETASYTYTGSTMVRNQYEDSISMAQVPIGEIVELEYEKVTDKVKELKVSRNAWELKGVTGFHMDRTDKTLEIDGCLYEYDSSIVIVSEGELVEPTEISDQDQLIVRGDGTKVYSIVIDKGHGYVSLENEDYFFGGILTIGKNVCQISNNMLVVVPEGEYVLEVLKGNTKGRKKITVERNQELTIDVREFVPQAKQVGTVSVKIDPAEAILRVNGKETPHKEILTLNYGTYTFQVEAEGYMPYAERYQVENSYQEKIILLEQQETASAAQEETTLQDQTTVSETSTAAPEPESTSFEPITTPARETTVSLPSPENQTQTTKPQSAPAEISTGDVTGYKIHITEPSGIEVYFDGSYKGVAPISLDKVSGQHTIILKKDGYVTKTHTVNITSDQIDSYYSFPSLEINN